MNIPVLEQLAQEKVVSVSDVSWEEFKAIEAQLYAGSVTLQN